MLVSLPQSQSQGLVCAVGVEQSTPTKRQKLKTCASASAVVHILASPALFQHHAPASPFYYPMFTKQKLSNYIARRNFEFLMILLKWEENRTIMWTTRHLLQPCKHVRPLSLAQAQPKSLWHPSVWKGRRRSCSSTGTDGVQAAQDKILTVPNLLCVGRIVASPYLAFSIVEGELVKSLGIFCLAGFSDLVRKSIDYHLIEE